MAERLALVTGATGAVGPAVVRACLAAGYSVRAFSLDTPPGVTLPPDVEVRVGDVCDGQAVRSAAVGVDVVFHLAGLLHQFENVAGLDGQFERVNVGGTENVVHAAIAVGVRRVVFFSTIAVYGPSSGHLIDERTPPRPATTYGRTKLAAEHVVLSARPDGQPIGAVLRSAAVYGSCVKGNYRRLAEAVARRRFVRLGRCLNRRTVVHESDLARAAVLAAGHPAASGAVFNVTDGQVHTLAEIIHAIYRGARRRPPRLYVPLGAARASATVCESTCRVMGLRPPVTRSLLEKYGEDVAVDGTLIQRDLGFAPLVNLEAGWQETMASLRDRDLPHARP